MRVAVAALRRPGQLARGSYATLKGAEGCCSGKLGHALPVEEEEVRGAGGARTTTLGQSPAGIAESDGTMSPSMRAWMLFAREESGAPVVPRRLACALSSSLLLVSVAMLLLLRGGGGSGGAGQFGRDQGMVPLEEEWDVSAWSSRVRALGSNSGAVCSDQAAIPEAMPPRRYELSMEEELACYKALGMPGFAQRFRERNWCWVGLKHLGCHITLGNHLTWEENINTSLAKEGSPQRTLLPKPFQPLLDPWMCDSRDKGQGRQWTEDQWSKAWKWFGENVAVFVISLERDIRYYTIKSRLDELHISFTRVEGVNMSEVGALEARQNEGLIPKEFDLDRAQANAWTIRAGPMGGILGRVGCAAAHFRAHNTAVKDAEGRQLAVVFEDDTSPSDDFVPRLYSLVHEELPCDWEVVSLMSRCPYGKCISDHLTRVHPDGNEPESLCRGGVNYGFQGSLIRVGAIEKLQEKWSKVVFNASRPHCLDLDVALASISDRVGYYAVPFVQKPGFLTAVKLGSSRASIDKDCYTSRKGEPCHTAVIEAKKKGIYEHQDWFPGLSPDSSFEEFQAKLHANGEASCPMPCGLEKVSV